MLICRHVPNPQLQNIDGLLSLQEEAVKEADEAAEEYIEADEDEEDEDEEDIQYVNEDEVDLGEVKAVPQLQFLWPASSFTVACR